MSHDAVWELLPWLVNGTLQDGERAVVEAHLASCEACRLEHDRCRQTAVAVRDAGVAPSPHPAQLARLLERIEERELSREGALAAILAAPRGLRFALVAQAAVVVVLLAVIFWPAPAPRYRVLGDSMPPPSAAARGERHEVRVVFAPAASEAEIRQLLLELRAELVSGPSPIGAYTLRLPAASDGGEQLPVALAYLRSHPQVRFAEPVAGQGGE